MDSCAWNDSEDLARRASDLYDDNEYEEALGLLEKALHFNPANSELHFNKGLTLDALNRFQDAIEAYRTADNLDPNNEVTLNSLAVDYTRIGKYDQAIEIFEELQESNPNFEPSYCNRIIVYTEMGLHDMAETMFYLAQQVKEDCPLCYYNIGNLLFAKGKYDKAISCWEKTKSLEPTHPQIDYRLAQAYWIKGNTKKAHEYFLAEISKEKSPDIEVLLSYWTLLLERGEIAEAHGNLLTASKIRKNQHVEHLLGETNLHMGNIETAIHHYEKALSIDSNIEGSNYRLGQCYLKLKQFSKAETHLLNEARLDPDTPEILLDLGALLYERNYIDEAAHCFLRAIDIKRNDHQLYHNLSCISFLGGKIENGIKFSSDALELWPKHLPSLENLFHYYLFSGNLEKAKAYLDMIEEYTPNYKKLNAVNRMDKKGLIVEPGLQDKLRVIEFFYPQHNSLKSLKKLFKKAKRSSLFYKGSKSIEERMRKVMFMEHTSFELYSHHIPNREWGIFRNNASLPPLMVRKADWRK